MYVSTAYLNTIADAGAGEVAKIILVDVQTAASYPGDQVGEDKIEGSEEDFEMDTTEDGVWRPDRDLTFTIDGGDAVRGWRALDSLDNIIGGADLTEETYTNEGQYTLLAAQTGFVHALQE